ncbi:MAG: hypothetical protein U0527_11645 [Candidatus Eisenbacteria bacterium]
MPSIRTASTRPRAARTPALDRRRPGTRSALVAELALGIALVVGTAARGETRLACDTLDQSINSATPAARLDTAIQGLALKCPALSAELRLALRQGHWADGTPLRAQERTNLFQVAIGFRYTEAESLCVEVLSGGRWPEGGELDLSDGIGLVRSLKPALTPYRTRLLLDVYEQLPDDEVHAAVIETLAGRPEPEAWLPALEAHWEAEGDARVAAEAALAAKQGQDPDALLATLIQTLPNDNTLAWAIQIAKSADAPLAKKAAAKRKK